jgi:methionyl-tRNA formyltransferase
VILSWFWPRLIPDSVLRLAPRGAFGVHPSLLPRWRGPDPYFWTLLGGDSHTGVTLHGLANEYDTGDLVAQYRIAIDPAWNAWLLAKRLDSPSLHLLMEAAQQLASGMDLGGAAQDPQWITQAPAPGEDLLALKWRAPAEELVRQVRALSPYPGVATTLGDEEVEILGASVHEARLPRALEPGDAVLSARGVVICSGQGGVLIERVRLEDGTMLRGVEVAELFAEGLFRLAD